MLSISSAMVSKLTTVPALTMFIVSGLKTPEGMMCSANLPSSLITVCPALSPPWNLMTIWASRAR